MRLKKEIVSLKIPDYKIYFIDNTEKNRGYAGGVNIGIKKALKDKADVLVVANPDVSLNNLKAENILEGLSEFDILGYSMRQQGKIYYGGELDRNRLTGGLIQNKPEKRFFPCDFVSGSLMVIKKRVIEEIGFFDESYFMYYEEVDYCLRAKKLGLSVGIDTESIYDHFETSQNNPTREFYLFKNHLKFLWKYGNVKQKLYELVRTPKTIFEEINKRSFYLNFFSLNVSSLINKILHFILFVLMIRVFTPSDYALYTLAWAHISLLSPLLDFGTTSYGLVYLPKLEEKDTSKLFSMRVVLSAVAFILTILLALAFRYPTKELVPVLILSTVILSNGLSGSFLIFSSIIEKSYLVSIVTLIFQVALVIGLIATVFISRSIINVFYMTLAFYLIYALVNYLLIKKLLPKIRFHLDFPGWIKIAKKSLIFLGISLLANFYSQADIFILNFIKGPKEVGVYTAGYRFLDALMFIVTAYNIASLPVFSKLSYRSDGLFMRKVRNDSILVGLIGLFIALVFLIFGPVFLPIFMKGSYLSAIRVVQIVVFALPLILLTSVGLNSLYALNRAKIVVYLFTFQLLYNLTTNFLFVPRYGYIASSFITLIGELLNTVIVFIILKKALNENFGRRRKSLQRAG